MTLRDRVIAGFGPEDSEQFTVIQWADAMGIDVWHVPNSTWTKSPMQRMKNTLLGVRAGIADLWFPIAGIGLVVVELKRANIKSQPKGRVSPEQQAWLDKLNACPGVQAQVCFGAGECIKYVEQFIIIRPSVGQRTGPELVF